MVMKVQRTHCICGETLSYLNVNKPSAKDPMWLLQIYHGTTPMAECTWSGLDGYIYLARLLMVRAAKSARTLDFPCAGAWDEAADAMQL